MTDTQHANIKYRGDVARDYETRRSGTKKWKSEQRILSRIVSNLPQGTTVLDIPCGTGRMEHLYRKHRITAIGMDVNAEMSDQARAKGWEDIRYGNVTYIPLGANSVDVSFCLRLLNWLGEDDVRRALKELQRVTREKIIFTLRVAEHPRARPLSLVEECLDGWKITGNRHIDDGKPQKTFRMITLEAEK